MIDWMTPDDAGEALPTTWTDAPSDYLYTAEIIVARDQPAQCVIFEQAADGTTQMTALVTAQEGSFVSLEEMQ